MKEEYSEIISNHTQKTDTVRIAVAVTEDAEKLAELEKNTFSMPWSRDAFLESMQKDYAVFLKACLNEDIVGYIGVYKVYETGDITNIVVDKKYRRKGIATKLLLGAICECKKSALSEMMLEVRESNTGAISLYEKLSFRAIGIRKNFYEKPVENAVIMQLELK